MAPPSVLRVPTRCRSREELIAVLAPLADHSSIVVHTDEAQPVGSAPWFAIELADGTTVMRGQAEVLESDPSHHRLRLRLVKLDPDGREAHGRMLAAGTRPPPFRGTTTLSGMGRPAAAATFATPGRLASAPEPQPLAPEELAVFAPAPLQRARPRWLVPAAIGLGLLLAIGLLARLLGA